MDFLRETLARYDIRPRKRLGQSFLRDSRMVRRISALADPRADETVVEIGAGLGLLTAELAKGAGRVVALEIDPRLVRVLEDRFADNDRVKVVQADVLMYDMASASDGKRVKVVGNIPYHISTPILFRLLAFRRMITSMVLMFQKELADRITAGPGKKEYGILSVLFARYTDAVPAITVPPACFYPAPRVVSSVLRFSMRDHSGIPEEESWLVATVRSSFAQRRKTLRNNLRATGVADEVLDAVLAKARIDGSRRAETLTLGEFRHLAAELAECGDAWKMAGKFLTNGGLSDIK